MATTDRGTHDEIERCLHGVAWDDDCNRCCDFCGASITGVPGAHSCYAGDPNDYCARCGLNVFLPGAMGGCSCV